MEDKERENTTRRSLPGCTRPPPSSGRTASSPVGPWSAAAAWRCDGGLPCGAATAAPGARPRAGTPEGGGASRESEQVTGEEEEGVCGCPQGYIWTRRQEFQDTVSPLGQVWPSNYIYSIPSCLSHPGGPPDMEFAVFITCFCSYGRCFSPKLPQTSPWPCTLRLCKDCFNKRDGASHVTELNEGKTIRFFI